MRYQVGEIIPIIKIEFVPKPNDTRGAWSYLYRPDFHNITSLKIKRLQVIEHHKVPGDYNDETDLKYDGYVLKELGVKTKKPRLWTNQFPTASYGQLSDIGDRKFHRDHRGFTKEAVKRLNKSYINYLCDDWDHACAFLDIIYRGIKELENDMEPKYMVKFKHYANRIRDLIEQTTDMKCEYVPVWPEYPAIKHTILKKR